MSRNMFCNTMVWDGISKNNGSGTISGRVGWCMGTETSPMVKCVSEVVIVMASVVELLSLLSCEVRMPAACMTSRTTSLLAGGK